MDAAAAFRRYMGSRAGSKLIQGIAALADDQNLTRASLDALCAELGLSDLAQAKEELLDLVLYYIRVALADHHLTDEELGTIRDLKRLFRIEEGDFLNRRRDDVSELVMAEMNNVLADRQVDHAEAVHKVRLQEALDLGYDDFLEVSRPAVEQVVATIFEEGRTVEGADLDWFLQRIAALDTVYQADAFLRRVIADARGGIAGVRSEADARLFVPARLITQEVKDMVWRRDQGRCAQCGGQERLEFDHIIPFSRGGASTYRNIQLLCEACNRRKSNRIG